MSDASRRPASAKQSSLTSEVDGNNMSLFSDQADQPFLAPAFSTQEKPPAAEDVDEMPSNLMNSHSNVPGMTPQELMAAHRRSIAAIAGNGDREVDLHSLTLSRHQVEPEDVYRADMDDFPDEEYQACLSSFKFGEAAEPDDDDDAIRANK